MNTEFIFSFVKPICLPVSIANKNYDGLVLTAAGWGLVSCLIQKIATNYAIK